MQRWQQNAIYYPNLLKLLAINKMLCFMMSYVILSMSVLLNVNWLFKCICAISWFIVAVIIIQLFIRTFYKTLKKYNY